MTDATDSTTDTTTPGVIEALLLVYGTRHEAAMRPALVEARAQDARLAALEAENARLRDAAVQAYEHVSELREAWERGVMREGDGSGGLRSNRNMDVYVSLRAALAPAATEVSDVP